jgi:tripartite-type tricarboxylate transporter receptor subunit TctC
MRDATKEDEHAHDQLVAAVTTLSLMTAPAVAQGWPTRPVTMVVPTTPGGAPDLLGRVVASRLSELLGQPVIVENVVGAGGMIGAARVAWAPWGTRSLAACSTEPSHHPGPAAQQLASTATCP